jgi:Arylsulfotransferase (ASST)
MRAFAGRIGKRWRSTSVLARRSALAALAAGTSLLALPPIPLLSGGAPANSAVPNVFVFPSPGSRAALPQTQIAFRGEIPAAGSITVTGSASGAHNGRIVPDSDNHGASFYPNSPFDGGETVTVSTAMDIIGGSNGTYSFTVADPSTRSPFGARVTASRVPGDIERFRSRPDLAPAAIRITANSSHTASGDLFLEPQSSPVQDGPEIRNWRGTLLWYKVMPKNEYVSDFRPQTLDGHTVLTWWQGFVNNGVGAGEDVIANDKYQTIAVLQGADGTHPDLHEFQISRRGTALVTSYYPIWWNESAAGGPSRATLDDSIVQEIDIPTGNVLFEWNAADHVPVSDSYQKPFQNVHHPWDFFHVNSIQELPDGNLVIGSRNTWAAYKINRHTGAIMWRLGGKHSSFSMGSGAGFAYEHDVRLLPHYLVTMFDDGAGPPVIHRQSRLLGLRLDFKHMRASLVFSDDHSPSIVSYFEGSTQALSNGDYFAGWGSDPHFSEFNSRGQLIFDAHFVASAFHNRAYRFRWNATPNTLPAVAASTSGHTTTVWASWNGATGVGGWRVLAGSSPSGLRTVKTTGSSGFETAISIGAASYVAVVALDSRGHPISQQSTVIRG